MIAVRADSQMVAAFGLVAVLLAPPLMGASPDMSTLAFVAIVLIGTTGVALWRSWSWLPPTAFVLAAPQAASWVMREPEPALGLLGVGLFWLLNIVAAGGEAFRRRRDDVSASSATLLLANVAFAIWAGFVLLSGELEVYRGFFLVYLALAQLGVGGYFVVRDGERVSVRAPRDGHRHRRADDGRTGPARRARRPDCLVRRSRRPRLACRSAGSSVQRRGLGILYVLAGMATANLYEAPIEAASGVPFIDAPGGSLGFFIAAIALGVWIVRDRTLRTALVVFGLIVAAICVPTVLDAPGVTIALSILIIDGRWRLANRQGLSSRPDRLAGRGAHSGALQRIGDWRRPVDLALPITTALLEIAATWWIVVPVYALGAGTAGARVPFVDPAGGALVVYLVALGAVGWIAANFRLREGVAALGLFVAAWASAVELEGVALVGAWSALMVVEVRARPRARDARPQGVGQDVSNDQHAVDPRSQPSAVRGADRPRRGTPCDRVRATDQSIRRRPAARRAVHRRRRRRGDVPARRRTHKRACGRRAGQTRVIPCRRRGRRVRHPVRGLRLGGRRPVGWPWRACARDVADRP